MIKLMNIIVFASVIFNFSCSESTSPEPNTAPVSSFTIDPSSGTTETIFQVDASASSDAEDPSSALEIRWDWENDNNWDTDYSTSKMATHQYTSGGTKTIKLEVKDTDGLSHTTTTQVSVLEIGTVADIDGNVYQTVKIGNQWWMAENLKVTQYQNGDPITNVTDNTEWVNLSTGAYCVYANNNDYIDIYGYLYNWYAVDDTRNIAPQGWHVPTDSEWQTLVNFLGGNSAAGEKLKAESRTYWTGQNTNESGFTALPGGFRFNTHGAFSDINVAGLWWTATESDVNSAWYFLVLNTPEVSFLTHAKQYGFSVRCIKD